MLGTMPSTSQALLGSYPKRLLARIKESLHGKLIIVRATLISNVTKIERKEERKRLYEASVIIFPI